MKYIFEYDGYNFNRVANKNNTYMWTFILDEYSYRIDISKCEHSDYNNYYWLSFKAKGVDSHFYDYDILVNKNPYKIMRTIRHIIEQFIDIISNKVDEYNSLFNVKLYINDMFNGFLYTLNSSDKKKNEQRFKLYSRVLRDLNYVTDMMIVDDNIIQIKYLEK